MKTWIIRYRYQGETYRHAREFANETEADEAVIELRRDGWNCWCECLLHSEDKNARQLAERNAAKAVR